MTSGNYSHGQRNKKSVKTSKKAIIYRVADFETTTDPDDCRVWGWGLQDLKREDVEIGTTLDEFMNRIDDARSIIYFHNLKFDGHFIIDWLLKNDYRHVTPVGARRLKLDVGEFTTLISDMGKFYSMNVVTHEGITIEFRDSLKKLPMTVERIARAFNLPEAKGDIDYTLDRPEGWTITPEERDYIRRDVNIVARALKETLDEGHQKLTIGSDALAEFQSVITKPIFERLFPVLGAPVDAEIRRAYRGGFTYADPRYAKKRLGCGRVYDVNSLYPHVMYSSKLPYGEPQFVRGRVEPTDSHPLTIFSVTFTARLKRNHIPCIQIKGQSQFVPTEYQTVIEEPTTLMVTDVDWKLYNDHYHIEVLEYGGGFRFKAIENVFKQYIDKWMKIKANSTGGRRELAKLMLNSLYGKFASNPNVTSKYPVLDDDRVKYKRGKDETRPPVYTAMGVFITAYARDITIRAAQQNYGRFAYADTDSLHLMGMEEPEGFEVHRSNLGAWKHEYDFVECMYLRPKAYMEKLEDGSYVNKLAGMPERVTETLTFDDVRPGVVLTGKLAPKSVPGGIVLAPIPFELNY